MRDTERLHATLQSMAPLPAEEWEVLAKLLTPTKLQTGDELVTIGGSPEPAGFVVSGLIKAYYPTRGGAEFIRNFCEEGSFAAAYAALLRGDERSEVTLVALEPTTLLTFPFKAYRQLLTRHWAWQQISRAVAESYYLLRERRQYELLTMPAEARLASFLAQYPGLAARISQKDLAAYVGITPVSLSRMRGKKQKAGERKA